MKYSISCRRWSEKWRIAKREVFYLLAPYETLVAGGKLTAIVRLAKRAETSKLYKSVQHVREKFN